MSVVVRRAGRESIDRCLALRRRVFVEEQGVSEDLEVDGEDDRCEHFLATDDEEALGTARLRAIDPRVAKAERVCVDPKARSRGVGAKLMLALEDFARSRGFAEVALNAQTPVERFYARLGYVREGDEFFEAGIPHVAMRKFLT